MASKDIGPGGLIIAEEPLFKVKLTPEGDLLGKFSLTKREFISPPLFKVLNELPDNDLITFYSLAGMEFPPQLFKAEFTYQLTRP